MTGFSRFIIVSSLPENVTTKDFTTLCLEFGPIRSCRVQKSDNGTISGFCEFVNCDSATMAVQNLNVRSQKEGSQIRASFSKSRLQNARTCHIRVKYLPKNIAQEDVYTEFGRYGAITRCKIVQYEQNSTAHLSFDSIESADLARQSMNGQCWSDHSDRLMIEFNSAYPSNGGGRKSNPHPDQVQQQQQQAQSNDFLIDSSQASSFVDDQAAAAAAVLFSQQQHQQQQQQQQQATQFYNFMQQSYVDPAAVEYQQQKQPGAAAQFVQLNSYCWPGYQQQQPQQHQPPAQQSSLMYESPTGAAPNQPQTNGLAAQNAANGLANSPPIKQNTQDSNPNQQWQSGNPAQWAQFYSQLVQQMQNTHLYPAAAANNVNQYTGPNQYAAAAAATLQQQNASAQPLILSPQSVYCATALSPSPQNYSLFLNPGGAAAAAAGGYFRGLQPQMNQSGFRYPTSQFRPVMNYQMGGGGGGGSLPGGGKGGQMGGGGRGTGGGVGANSNNTLYVYNTGNSMTEEGLRALFSRFGTIVDVSVPRDPTTGASRNFGFVNYLDAAAARVAIEQMNGFMFYDRVLQVSYKRPRVSTNTQRNSSSTGTAGTASTAANGNKDKKEEPAPSRDESQQQQPQEATATETATIREEESSPPADPSGDDNNE